MKKSTVLIALGVVEVVIGYALFADNAFSHAVLTVVGYRARVLSPREHLFLIGECVTLASVAAGVFLRFRRTWFPPPVPVRVSRGESIYRDWIKRVEENR